MIVVCCFKPEKNPLLYRLLRIPSVILLIAVPFLVFDFYEFGYGDHFHLGLGAYLIVFAYLLFGISLWLLSNAINSRPVRPEM
jgi:hypothetical protein